MASVSTLVAGLLDRGYEQAARATLNAIGTLSTRGIIAQRLTELDDEARRLAALGQRLTPDNAILRALLADLDSTLNTASTLIDSAAEPVQATAQTTAANIQRQLALGSATNEQLARIGIVWNTPDPEAVARLVSYAQSDAWRAALSAYPSDIIDTIANQAIRGIASGWNPLRIAREIRAKTQAIPAHLANTLMRTLQLQSYRDATAIAQNANSAIARQVVRIAALDNRTCLSCIALHGSIVWDSATNPDAPIPRIDDHWNGRCTSVIIVKGFERTVTTGAEWFANLTPEQRANLESLKRSPGKLDALTSGRAQLSDFVHTYQDTTFGQMVGEGTLTAALKRK